MAFAVLQKYINEGSVLFCPSPAFSHSYTITTILPDYGTRFLLIHKAFQQPITTHSYAHHTTPHLHSPVSSTNMDSPVSVSEWGENLALIAEYDTAILDYVDLDLAHQLHPLDFCTVLLETALKMNVPFARTSVHGTTQSGQYHLGQTDNVAVTINQDATIDPSVLVNSPSVPELSSGPEFSSGPESSPESSPTLPSASVTPRRRASPAKRKTSRAKPEASCPQGVVKRQRGRRPNPPDPATVDGIFVHCYMGQPAPPNPFQQALVLDGKGRHASFAPIYDEDGNPVTYKAE